MVQDLHRRGYRVSTYTVDDPEEIRRVLELGVDAVISNDIRLLREVIADIYGKGRS
jgi:glycerophosphoryl diester phosphodiesterase